MAKSLTDIELTPDDFGDITPDDVKCRGCNGPLCGDKTPKLYNGELLFVCHLGTAGNTVLARAAQRAHAVQRSSENGRSSV